MTSSPNWLICVRRSCRTSTSHALQTSRYSHRYSGAKTLETVHSHPPPIFAKHWLTTSFRIYSNSTVYSVSRILSTPYERMSPFSSTSQTIGKWIVTKLCQFGCATSSMVFVRLCVVVVIVFWLWFTFNRRCDEKKKTEYKNCVEKQFQWCIKEGISIHQNVKKYNDIVDRFGYGLPCCSLESDSHSFWSKREYIHILKASIVAARTTSHTVFMDWEMRMGRWLVLR